MITEKQREQRKNYIGGSDISIILGLSSYKTPYQLFLEKTGILQQEYEESDLQEWGNRLEPVIRVKFAEKHNVRVIAPKSDEAASPQCSLISFELEPVTHPFCDYLQGNLDGFIPEWNAVHEMKCANSFMAKEWGDPETDTIPMQYLVQVVHYVACTNADKAIISVLIGGYDYREYIYTRDLELENMVINAAKSFWLNVQNNIAPNAITINDLSLMYPSHVEEKSQLITTNEQSVLESMREVKESIKQLQKQEEQYKFQIMEYMQDAECLINEEGKKLATWKANKKGTRTFLLKGV